MGRALGQPRIKKRTREIERQPDLAIFLHSDFDSKEIEMKRTTKSTAMRKFGALLTNIGYSLTKTDAIDCYFRRGNRVAVVQVSTHLGITQIMLMFGLDHNLTRTLIELVSPVLKIWNVRGTPFLHCPIVSSYTADEFLDEFGGELPDVPIEYGYFPELDARLYYAGFGRPRLPSVKTVNLTMMLPKDRELAFTKISQAVELEEDVFAKILPAMDGMLPCLEPAWFLYNTTPSGSAIMMLARATELGVGTQQLEFFRQYMLSKHGPQGSGLESEGWMRALPMLSEFIRKRES